MQKIDRIVSVGFVRINAIHSSEDKHGFNVIMNWSEWIEKARAMDFMLEILSDSQQIIVDTQK